MKVSATFTLFLSITLSSLSLTATEYRKGVSFGKKNVLLSVVAIATEGVVFPTLMVSVSVVA